MAKKWCIVIPFKNKKKAIYAARCLKDYSVLDKHVKEVEVIDGEEDVEYAYLR